MGCGRANRKLSCPKAGGWFLCTSAFRKEIRAGVLSEVRGLPGAASLLEQLSSALAHFLVLKNKWSPPFPEAHAFWLLLLGGDGKTG